MDKKLIVDIDEIVIKSQKSSVNSSYEDLKRDITILPKLLKVFQRINVNKLLIGDNELSIQLNDEFLYLDNKFVNLSSKVEFLSNQVVFDLYSIYLKDVNLLLDGKLKVDYFNEKLDFFGQYLYEELSGDVKVDIDEGLVSTYLNSNSFKSLSFLKKYFRLPEVAEAWMYDNVTGDIKLKEFYGTYDLNKNELLMNTLKGKAEILNANIKFHKDVQPIITKNLEVEYDNDSLKFNLIEPKYFDYDMTGSNVVINNLTSADNGEVEVNIKANAKLDNKIQTILKAFKINIPLMQKSGTTDASLKLIFPYVEAKPMTTLGEFNISDSEIFINKFSFKSKSAKVNLDGSKISIIDADFKYKNMIDAIANLELDTKTLISSGSAKVAKLYVGDNQTEILNIKNFTTALDMNFDKQVVINLKDLQTSINVNETINIKVDDLSKLYNYSKLLKDNGLKAGNIELKIKDENNLDLITTVKNLELPLQKDGVKITSLDLTGNIKDGNISIISKDESVKLEKNKGATLKVTLKDLDVFIADDSNNSNEFPTLDASLVNSKLFISDSIYNIRRANVNLRKEQIDFDVTVFGLDLPLKKNDKKIEELDLKGNYKKDDLSLYTKTNDLNFMMKKNDFTVDLNGYEILYSTEDSKKDENEQEENKKNFNITAKNSTIIMNDKYRFVSDTFEVRTRKDSTFLNLNYKNSEITYKQDANKRVTFLANNISDEFINNIYSKKVLNGGNYMVAAKGELNNLEGKVLIENSKVEDLAILNNLLLFIHTSPALINPLLAIPSVVGMATNGGFNLTGYQITNGSMDFVYHEDKELLDIKRLITVGNGIDFEGSGKINLNDKTLESKIKLIFLKDYSKIVGAIPIINYVFLGDAKRVETEVDIFGPLENPKLSTNLTKDTFSVPVNIAKRILESPTKLLDFVKENNKEGENKMLNKPKEE